MFWFNNKQYEYFDHPSNQTRVNERRVELPLAFEFVKSFKEGQKITEVGNVTHHYHREYTHDVVDLYETVPWMTVINEDILKWRPLEPHFGLFSISTLEHTANPQAAAKRMLEFAPKILITFPIGAYTANKILDLDFTKLEAQVYFMHRVSEDNDWEQCDEKTALTHVYGEPYMYGNAIAIIRKGVW